MAIDQDVSVREQTSLGGGFRRLFVASTLSNIGDGVVVPAFGLLAASLTREPLLVAAVPAAMWLPWLLVGPLSGALSDRADRRRMLVDVDGARFVLFAALGILVLADAVSIGALLLVAFLSGVAETLFDTSAEAIVPAVIGRDQRSLERANGLLQTSETVTNRLAGPPLGGILYSVGASLPFLLDAVTFGAAAFVVSGLRGRFRPEAAGASAVDVPEQASLWADAVEGARWLRGDRLLLLITVLAAFGNLGLALAESTLVLFAQDLLGLDAVGYGILLGAGAVGAVLGSLVAARLAGRIRTQVLLPVTFAVAGTSQLLLGVTSDAVVAGAVLGVVSGVAVWTSVLVRSLRQAAVPDRLLGRVVSAQRAVALGALPVGALLSGLLASWLGLRAPILLAGMLHVVMAVAAFGSLRRIPLPDTRTVS